MTTVIYRRRKWVEQLKDDNGVWCDNLIVLEMRAMEFYKNLYTTEGVHGTDSIE